MQVLGALLAVALGLFLFPGVPAADLVVPHDKSTGGTHDRASAHRRSATSRCDPRPRRLADEFDGVFGAETIERFLTSSYDQFASRATATNFLPIMAERFARQRLKALARVEGKAHDGLPDRPVPLRAQRRALPDGAGVVQPPRRATGPSRGRAGRSPATR